MKRLVILGLLLFLGFCLKVDAEVDWQSLGNKMKTEAQNANKNSVCFNSNVTVSNSEIKINYTAKTDSEECRLVDDWQLKISNDGVILRFNSSLTNDLIDKYSTINYGLKSLIDMDNYWILKLVEFLGLNVSDANSNVFYLYKNTYVYSISECAPNGGGCALNRFDLPYYDAFGFILSGSALKFTNITKNSVHLKFYNIKDNLEYCSRFERSLDNVNYVSLGEKDKCYYEFDDTGLEANTTYYYRFSDEVAKVTTLKDEEVSSGGNQSSGGNSSGNQNNNGNQSVGGNNNSSNNSNQSNGDDRNNINNPQTGLDSVMILLIILGCILTFIFSRWNYYNKKSL